MIYMVECSFTDPQCEQEWNDYYSGPKLDQVQDLSQGLIFAARICSK